MRRTLNVKEVVAGSDVLELIGAILGGHDRARKTPEPFTSRRQPATGSFVTLSMTRPLIPEVPLGIGRRRPLLRPEHRRAVPTRPVI